MSILRLYDPECADSELGTEFPATVPLRRETQLDASEWRRQSPRESSHQAAQRAHMLRQNSTCPHCQRGGVIPLLLNDGVRGFGNQTVPGTGSLVGFRCITCHGEWPAGDRAAN